jgi:hypothetical protein
VPEDYTRDQSEARVGRRLSSEETFEIRRTREKAPSTYVAICGMWNLLAIGSHPAVTSVSAGGLKIED